MKSTITYTAKEYRPKPSHMSMELNIIRSLLYQFNTIGLNDEENMELEKLFHLEKYNQPIFTK